MRAWALLSRHAERVPQSSTSETITAADEHGKEADLQIRFTHKHTHTPLHGRRVCVKVKGKKKIQI